MLQVKGILSNQGRCIPNFLHILAAYQLASKSIDSLAEHLNKRVKEINKRDPTRWSIKSKTVFKFRAGLAIALVGGQSGRSRVSEYLQYSINLLDEELRSSSYPQYLYPHVVPADEYLLKPPEYCYMERFSSPEKEIDFDEGIKQGVFIQN